MSIDHHYERSLCHKDIQCCVRSILCWSHYSCLCPYTKGSLRDVKKLLNKLHQGAITIIIIFAVIALKLEKGLPNFFKFQSISIIAIRCIRRQETVSIPKFSVKKQNGTISFGIQLMIDARESFNFLKR